MKEMNDQLSLENYSPFEVEKKWQEKWESLKPEPQEQRFAFFGVEIRNPPPLKSP